MDSVIFFVKNSVGVAASEPGTKKKGAKQADKDNNVSSVKGFMRFSDTAEYWFAY